MELDLFEEVHICCMARSLRSLRQVATLRHGHMARRFASLLHLGHFGYVNTADYVIMINSLTANLTH